MDLKRKYLVWKQNSATEKVFEEVEIISFHLPKTGGVSFRNALKKIYKNHLVLLYGSPFQERINHQKPIWIPKSTKVIHGHFQPHAGLKKQFPNAKWVIWFRPPQQRIVSHYNYWKAHPQQGKLYEHFEAEIHTFKDFVTSKKLKEQVCLYQTYLRKSNLSNFDFIGDLNRFDDEMNRFGKIFGMQMPTIEKLNKSEKLHKEDYFFDEDMLETIKKETEIYEQICAIK